MGKLVDHVIKELEGKISDLFPKIKYWDEKIMDLKEQIKTNPAHMDLHIDIMNSLGVYTTLKNEEDSYREQIRKIRRNMYYLSEPGSSENK